MKILILSSNTGNGHSTAAHAIADSMKRIYGNRQCQTVIVNAVEESCFIHHMYVSLYNFLLQRKQNWVKYYYKFVEQTDPNSSNLGYALIRHYLAHLLRTTAADIVVSVHPMTNHFVARALRELRLSPAPKLIVVVTDPSDQFWSGWACPDADLTIVPNDCARTKLLELGIPSEKISVIGMPIDPSFLKEPREPREVLLKRFGLDPRIPTICLTAGFYGGGNCARIYNELTKLGPLAQAIVICGNNQALQRKVTKQAQHSTLKTIVLPRVDSLSDLMNACDLLVTKAGGLTTFEAMARRIPMAIDMITEPMPQELATAKMLINSGLAVGLTDPSEIVDVVNAIARKPLTNRKSSMIHAFAQPKSADDIAKEIIRFSCETNKAEKDAARRG